jgi:hypothetical protein
VTAINPTNPNIPLQTSGIDGPAASTGPTQTGQNTIVPPASGSAAGAGSTQGATPPVLPAPTGLPGDVDMEALIKLISEQSRKEGIQGAIDSIKARGETKIKNLNEQIEQIKKQLGEAKNQESMSPWKKVLSWIGAVVGVIAAVAAVVATAGAATPLLVGAVIMAGVALASLGMQIAQEATGGKYFPGYLVSKLLQKFGVDEKIANIAGAAVVGLLMLAGSITGLIMSGGASASTTVSSIQKVAKIIKVVAATIQAVTTMAAGGLTIASAVSAYDSAKAGISLKELQALLEKLRSMTEQEEDFLKALVEEQKMITEIVQKIVDGSAETVEAILSGAGAAPAPSMA